MTGLLAGAGFLEILFWLLVGHAACDFAFQTDWMARSKDPWHGGSSERWPHALFAHCMLQGGAVAMVTGSVALAAAEVVIHFAVDMVKCRGLVGMHADQALHVACKLAWAAAFCWAI